MSENLRNYTRAVYTLDAVVQRVGADQWDSDTPCPDWTAREVLGHIIWGMNNVASLTGDGEAPAQPAEADIAGADPVASWGAARDRVLSALDHQGALQRTAVTPFGEHTIDDTIAFHQFDALAHAWDIATACGIDPCLPADLAGMGAAGIAAMGDALRAPGAMGPAVDVAPDADAVARFVAMTGRRP